MLRIAMIVATLIVVAPASWAEEPVPDAAAVTTTTRPERSPYRARANDTPNLPTGLPGFGTPGPPPPRDQEKDVPKDAASH